MTKVFAACAKGITHVNHGGRIRLHPRRFYITGFDHLIPELSFSSRISTESKTNP